MDAIIEVLTGKVGSGKTYSAVERIYLHLLRGGIVYTNIDLAWEKVAHYAYGDGVVLDPIQYQKFTNEQVPHFYNCVQAGLPDLHTLIVVDEAQLFWNSRDYKQTSRELMTFVTQTRKVNCSILLLTQHESTIDKQFRLQIQYLWRFRDLQKWRFQALGFTYPFPHILQTCLDSVTLTEMSRRFATKDKKIFQMYESKALLVDLHLKDMYLRPQTSKVSRINRLKHYIKHHKMKAILFLALIIGCLTFAGTSIYRKFHNNGIAGVVAGEKAPPPSSQTSSSAALPQTTSNNKNEKTTFYRSTYQLRTSDSRYGVGQPFEGSFIVGFSPQGLVLADGRTVYYKN